jgi:hypothetical protein
MWSHEKCMESCTEPSALAAPVSIRENENEIVVRWDQCMTKSLVCTDCTVELVIDGPNGFRESHRISNTRS